MLGFEIFARVQTFRRRPFVPSHNFCHAAKSKDQDHKTVLAAKDKLLTGQGMDWTEKGDFFLWGKCDFGLRAGWQAQWNNKTCTNTLQSVTSFVKVDCRWKDLSSYVEKHTRTLRLFKILQWPKTYFENINIFFGDKVSPHNSAKQ